MAFTASAPHVRQRRRRISLIGYAVRLGGIVATTANQIYREHVRALPAAERLALISLIASELAAERGTPQDGPKHRLTELRGLGKEIWEGIDAQEYADRLRGPRPDDVP